MGTSCMHEVPSTRTPSMTILRLLQESLGFQVLHDRHGLLHSPSLERLCKQKISSSDKMEVS